MDVSSDESLFPQRLKEILDYRRMSQRQLSRAVGTSPRNVNLWVNGKSAPNLPSLIRIAETVGVTTDWLTGRSDSIQDIAGPVAGGRYLGCTERAADRFHKTGLAEQEVFGSTTLDVIGGSPLWTSFATQVQLYLSACKKPPTDPNQNVELGVRFADDVSFYNAHGYAIVSNRIEAEQHLNEAVTLFTRILRNAGTSAAEVAQDQPARSQFSSTVGDTAIPSTVDITEKVDGLATKVDVSPPAA